MIPGLGIAIGTATKGAIAGGVGGAISQGLGLLNPFNWGKRKRQKKEQLEAEQRAYDYSIKQMQEQANLNREQAKYNQQLALGMYRNTNYGAQIKEMKEQGLNPALIYNGAGQGGSTSGAGVAGDASLGQGSGIVGMGLQAKMLQAQIEATEAATAKTNAETAKISGQDAEKTSADIEKTKQEKELIKNEIKLKEYQNYLNDLTKEIKVETYVNDVKTGDK